jgi:hypothetical protein
MRYVFACVALIGIGACAGAEEEPQAAEAPEAPAVPALTPEQLELATSIRAATAEYADVAVAEAAGYMRDPTNMCVTAEMVGAPAAAGGMGIHFFSPALLGITNPQPPVSGGDGVIDPGLPEILVYEPQMDGSMQLVAAEYLVFQDAWTAAGNTGLPVLAGHEFFSMADDPATPMDEAHGFAPHHELHVWTGRDNPNGLFAEFNPNVTCAHHAMEGTAN